MHIQVPPNLSYDEFPRLLEAGIDDWGGVSPVTIDHVNPEAPWPEIERLREATEAPASSSRRACRSTRSTSPTWSAGPSRASRQEILQARRRRRARARGPLGRRSVREQPARRGRWPRATPASRRSRRSTGAELDEDDVTALFEARGADLGAVLAAADELRREVVRRRGQLRRHAQHQLHQRLLLPLRLLRVLEGQARGEPARAPLPRPARGDRPPLPRGLGARRGRGLPAGRDPPGLHGRLLPRDLRGDQGELPDLHVHAFSALEVWQGAATLGLPLADYLARLRDVGLASLPGTAAEILDDEVRRILCPDKVTTEQWLEVHDAAHRVGLRSTTTIMFGSVEGPRSWARHLLALRELQQRTRRLHRVRAAPVRAHGGADLPQGRRAAGADLPRGGAHARRRAAGAAPVDHEHPGLVGEARYRRARRRRSAPERTTSAGRS